ncbi:uncharacterized protein LOC105662494 isoform X1 [Megachile rotundata]|uniref:uncharacterized protein LOC105662494 isoform X1 n=1 Tax=Megachile rotundata TaxID=143995 RepID=UPI003FD27112
MDLTKFSSRIICSDNITRQNLKKKPIVPITSDDDDLFFQKIRSKIDKDLLHSNENYKPNNCQSISSLKRKRFIIDEETENIIKRFKEDRNHKSHSVKVLDDISIPKTNHVYNNMIKTQNVVTNINANNILQQTNKIPSNVLCTNLSIFRNPSNNYIFQMASKLQKNILPISINETTFFQEEYEESLLYAMYLTPPNNNPIDDDGQSSTCSAINTII